MDFVIGIDGGGTKSTLIAADLEGNCIAQSNGGPTNMYATSRQSVKHVLTELLEDIRTKAHLDWKDCQGFCLGSAGIDRAEEKEWMRHFLHSLGIKGNIIITNDAEIALVAGSGKKEGIVVIAGTGSFGYGLRKDGQKARAGGWGHLIGDEGGAYYISIQALKAAVRAYDGREEETQLLPMIMAEIGLQTAEEFYFYVYQPFDKQKIASLAKIVHQASQLGDKKAREILLDAAKQLFLHADSIIRSLQLENEKITLVANGSVFLHNSFIYQHFCQIIQEKYPLIYIKKLEKEAAWGAVYISLSALQVEKSRDDPKLRKTC